MKTWLSSRAHVEHRAMLKFQATHYDVARSLAYLANASTGPGLRVEMVPRAAIVPATPIAHPPDDLQQFLPHKERYTLPAHSGIFNQS